MLRPSLARHYALALSSLVGLTAGSTAAAKPSASHVAPSRTILRIAHSSDGVRFEETDQVFLRQAAAPDLITLPSGNLLALVDMVDPHDPESTLIAVTRSSDDGKSWSSPRPIRLKTGSTQVFRPRHADIVFAPNGGFRIYFAVTPRRRSARVKDLSKLPTMIRSALTNNGLDFRLDPRTRILASKASDIHLMATTLDSHVHIYHAAPKRRSTSSKGSSPRAFHLISRGGRRFARMRPSRLPNVNFVGSIVNTETGLRAYVTVGERIRLLVSKDGRDWVVDRDGSFPKGRDPAVTQLKDESFLMVYCTTEPDKETGTDVSEVLAAASTGDLDGEDEWVVFDDYYLDDDAVEMEQHVEGVDEFDTPDQGTADGAIVLDDDDEHADELPGHGTDEIEREPEIDWKETWDPMESDGFAPVPNFDVNVDYMEWYGDYLLDQPDDNAYDAYAEFMPEEGFKGDPRFNDMFNSGDHEGPPAPWDPQEHDDWEESYQATQDVIEQYGEAGKREGYAAPPKGADNLMGIMLPSLSPHRTMARATLAAAWRKENGKVSAERMLKAWESVLRAASHLERGATLIEDLVASAERVQVQQTARHALKHDVFSADQLENALDTLRQFDRRDEEPAQSVRGEHGFAMDTVQQVFSPPSPDGQPQLNRERMESILDWSDTPEGALERVAQMTADDVHATLRAFDDHYRELAQLMNVGYPEVRGADIEALEQRRKHTSALTEILLPALGRVHQLRAREEASRRATQLAYVVHLFKARNGRFPKTLDELPDEHATDMRIDPFTGRYFGYSLTETGPRIYSLSENGVDDGGVHSPRWNDKVENDAGSDDFVFWPPQPK